MSRGSTPGQAADRCISLRLNHRMTGLCLSLFLIGNLAVRTGTSTKTAAEFLTFRFPFSCLYNSCISFSFCLKVCEYENLEALFLKLHED